MAKFYPTLLLEDDTRHLPLQSRGNANFCAMPGSRLNDWRFCSPVRPERLLSRQLFGSYGVMYLVDIAGPGARVSCPSVCPILRQSWLTYLATSEDLADGARWQP